MMKEKVIELYKKGYQVIIGSYYGNAEANLEDIEDIFEEEKEERYITLEIEIFHEKQMIEIFVHNEE